MQEHLGFLKTSSAVVKVAAWIFLFFGIVGGVAIMLGFVPQYQNQPWTGVAVFAFYTFFFFVFYIIAKIAELLMRIINEIHELKK